MNTQTVFNICYVLPMFADIAESMHFSLIELGFSSHLNQNIIINEATNIIFGAHLIQDQRLVPLNSIIFNLEQLGSNSHYCTPQYFDCLKNHTVWDYSKKNIDYLNDHHINPEAIFVSLAYSPELNRISKPTVQDIDVLFYGVVNERQQKILDGLKNLGLNLVVLIGVYGRELDGYIARSKTVINLDYYESKIFEIVRVSYLLNNKKVVISEVGNDTAIDPSIKNAIVGVEYDKLVESVAQYVNDAELRLKMEESSFHLYSQKTQTAILKSIFEKYNKKYYTPLFSIIIATHGRPQLLSRALQSLQNQTYPRYQVIIISDELNSQTYEVAARALKSCDVFIQRKGLPGPSESRNVGMQHIAGDYFLFLDDDDSFDANFLQNLVDQIPKVSLLFSLDNIFYTNFETINEFIDADKIITTKITSVDISEQAADHVFIKNFIPNNCLVFPRRLAKEIQFDPVIAYEDWDFILSACEKIPLRHLSIYGPRIHKLDLAANIPRGKSNDSSLLECYLTIYNKHAAPDSSIATLRKELFQSLGLDLDTLLEAMP